MNSISSKRSSPALSPTAVAYPSPHRSPSLEMSKISMVSSATRWSSDQIPTTSALDHENAWMATSYAQHKSPMHHEEHAYSSLPSPPHQTYGMGNDFVPTSMSMDQGPPRHLLSPPTSEVLLSNEHRTSYASDSGNWSMSSSMKNDMPGLGMSMEVPQTSSAMSSPLLNMGGYGAEDMGMGGMDLEGEGDSLRRWRSASDPNAGYDSKRPRRKRQLTGPEEANFRCEVCGKYFSRIWNYNAHKSTHDPNRLKPHLCTLDGCRKSFVRKTDLNRHQQCVHQKLKKFECSLCHNKFARKDTLRRHEDDGCPKRLDIVSRNNKAKPISISSISSLRFPQPDFSGYHPGREVQSLPQPDYRHYTEPSPLQTPSFLPPISVPFSKPQAAPSHPTTVW